jgi:hypothetical protein
MSKDQRVRICTDRIIPYERKARAAFLAVQENPANQADLAGARRAGATVHPMKMALLAGKLWKPGRTLRVRFLDGSPTQQARVTQHAMTWTKYANVHFEFTKKANAEIRISFKADPGSWSGVGTDCLVAEDFPKGEPTMNYGWLQDDTDDEEYRRVVLHEFGHALGAVHEHQNPAGGMEWNLKAVYKYFAAPPNNWSKDETYFNVVEKYSMDQLNARKFDKKSIMLYWFPPSLIVGAPDLPENTRLSRGDKAFIKKMYPKAP